jgi:hypothetical protein
MDNAFTELFGQEEMDAHHPPSSLVPRLHCLVLRPLSDVDEVVEHVQAHVMKLSSPPHITNNSNSNNQHGMISVETQAAYYQWKHSGSLLLQSSPFTTQSITDYRDMALGYIAEALHGDQLAACYVLASLCCHVTGRADNMPIGDFPLNLIYNSHHVGNSSSSSSSSSFERHSMLDDVNQLIKVVENLVPRMKALNLDIATLEHPTKLIPRKVCESQ